MIQKQYGYLGHIIKATENPFLTGGWAIECDSCSIPLAIARLVALCCTYNFENIKVDGQHIDYIGTFSAPGVPATSEGV